MEAPGHVPSVPSPKSGTDCSNTVTVTAIGKLIWVNTSV